MRYYGWMMLAFAASLGNGWAQTSEQKFGIEFHGYVKTDAIFDSRQNVSAREGHFLLWPSPELPDANGNDINAKTNFNILSVQSQLSGKITGPDVWGAKTSALLEGDFFGSNDDNINLLRLRHAYLKLNFPKTEWLVGQFWNPLFVTDCFPGVVSFNTGAPINPFSRNPQIRMTHKTGPIGIMVAALGQRDYTSAGGALPLRNATLPDVHAQLSFSKQNAETGVNTTAGAGLAYKSIVPSLVTARGYKTSSAVKGFSAMAYIKHQTKPVTIKLYGVYAQNLYDVLQISSYAVESVADTATQELNYLALSNLSVWSEVHTNGKLQLGIFGGYTKTLGAGDATVTTNFAGNRSNIDYLIRVSPRIVYNVEKLRFALESEITNAAFGNFTTSGKVEDAKAVTNFRLLFAAYYFF